jgi:GNAT superfamily N-acetyltransferase
VSSVLDTLMVEPLPPAFRAGGFDCGEPDLTDYLCDGTAARDEAGGMARTYLVRNAHGLVGYFSVLADAIRLETRERPRDCPYSAAPALKLGRMGVAREHRGQRVGTWILDYVVGLARELSTQAGLRYVTLDALKREKLVAWYARYGFVRNGGHEKGLAKLRSLASREDLAHVSLRFDILLARKIPG